MSGVRVLLLAAAAAAGAVAGALGSFVHPLHPLGLPMGLLLGGALSAAVYATAGLLLGRAGAVAAAGGWVVVVLLLTVRRPEGDLVVANDPAGYAWLLGGVLLAGAAAVPRYRPPRDQSPSGRAGGVR